MEHAPPLLPWLLVHLSSWSDSGKVVISQPGLERLVRTILNQGLGQQYQAVRPSLFAEFFNGDIARQFLEDTTDGEPKYDLDFVPIALGEFGLDISVDAWNRVAVSVVDCLYSNAVINSASSQCSSTLSSSQVSSIPTTETSSQNPWFDELTRDELIAKLAERDNKIAHLEKRLGLGLKTKKGLVKQHDSNMTQKELKGQGRRATNIRGKFRDQAKECKKLMREKNKIKAENMQLENTVNRLKGMLIERNGKYTKKKHVTEDGEQVSERGWLMPAGIVQLAIKRNLAHCASEHLQLIIQQDVSRFTVSRHSAF